MFALIENKTKRSENVIGITPSFDTLIEAISAAESIAGSELSWKKEGNGICAYNEGNYFAIQQL